jgi:formate hydrogenlyase subunit 3/multisubunit Na+/H+ antiporter MnhD subunit
MKQGKSTLTGLGAAILTVIGSISCCGAPIAAGIMASVGIGASQLQFLNKMQPYLIAIAFISLAFGFYRLYFKKSSDCCDTSSCCDTDNNSSGTSNRKSKIFLWIVTISTGIMLFITSQMSQPTTESSEPGCACSPSEETEHIVPDNSCCAAPSSTSCCPTTKESPKTSKQDNSCCGN